MADTTVKQLAEIVGTPVDRFIAANAGSWVAANRARRRRG